MLLKILRLSVDYLLMIKCIKNLNEIEFILNHDLIVLRLRQREGEWLQQFNPCKTKTVFFSMNKHIGSPKFFFFRAGAQAFGIGCSM